MKKQDWDLAMWFSQLWVYTVILCLNWADLCVCAVYVCEEEALWGLTQRWAPSQASAELVGDAPLAETVEAVFTAGIQALCRGCGGFEQICRLWPSRQVERLCSFLLRQQRYEYEERQMWIGGLPPLPLVEELRFPTQHSSLLLVNYRVSTYPDPHLLTDSYISVLLFLFLLSSSPHTSFLRSAATAMFPHSCPAPLFTLIKADSVSLYIFICSPSPPLCSVSAL